MIRIRPTPATILALLLVTLPNIAAADQLFRRGGSTLSGTVTETTPTVVTIDRDGNRQQIAVNEIRRIDFAGEPPELSAGRAKALSGRYHEGLAELKRVDPTTLSRDLIRQDFVFLLAQCEGRLALTAGGDKAKAATAMLSFVRAAPKSYHFFTAAELLGDLAVDQQDYAAAVRYYGAIADKAPFPDYKMRALIAEARALLAQDSFVDAETKFDSVLQIASDTAEAKRQKSLATVGKGLCLAETATPDEGLELISAVIAENEPDDGELFARAYNAQGDCLRKAGKEKEALMAYLHVDILFYSHPDTHAEALYRLSKLWKAAGKPDRAVSARNLLDQRYPGSVWARQK